MLTISIWVWIPLVESVVNFFVTQYVVHFKILLPVFFFLFPNHLFSASGLLFYPACPYSALLLNACCHFGRRLRDELCWCSSASVSDSSAGNLLRFSVHFPTSSSYNASSLGVYPKLHLVPLWLFSPVWETKKHQSRAWIPCWSSWSSYCHD